MTPAGPRPRQQLQGNALRELAIVHQLATTRLNRALKPLGLSMTHTSVLFHLARQVGGSTVGEVAAAMDVNQPAVSKTLRALADRGAVAIDTPADDARRRSVRLTRQGQVLLARAMTAMDPEATATFDTMGDRDLRTLVDLLARVRDRLDSPDRPAGG